MSRKKEEDERVSGAMGLEGSCSPFVELLGITFEPLDDDIHIELKMCDELALSFRGGTLNGAAISAIVEITGSTVVAWTIKDEARQLPLQEQARGAGRVSTIDLRVDYLRPGKGRVFTASGSVLRCESGVAVTRMELRNEDRSLIALGTGTYSVG